MSLGFLALLAFIPILTAFILMAVLGWPSTRAMPVALAAGLALAWGIWGQTPLRLVALCIEGVITALGVLIIVFGALLIYATLEESGAMETIQYGMRSISPDRRVQAIIIGYMFAAFIEGAAGFGTPAALAAPLLLGLGFPPLCAVILCLVFNSFPVTTGVAGIPTLAGFQSVQDVGMQALGTSDPSLVYQMIAKYASLMHLPMIFILPILMLGFMTRFFGANHSWKEGFRAWKYCLMASLCFAIPYMTLAWLTGPELPSLIGGLLGLGVLVYLTKKGIGVPTDGVWDFPPMSSWDSEWTGTLTAGDSSGQRARMSQLMAWMPYILCGLILMVTRVPFFGLKPFVTGYGVVSVTNILGFPGVGTKIQLLNLPGTIPFILVALITIPLHSMSGNNVKNAWKQALSNIKAPTIALISAVALVSVLKGSGVNDLGLPSMPMVMAEFMAFLTGNAWPLLASYVGGLGAFITGSCTVSNMLFANFQWNVADALQYSTMGHFYILAAQGVGGAMGNMICVHNIVAACAVLGLIGHEGAILRRTIFPFLLYGVPVGLIAAYLVAFCS